MKWTEQQRLAIESKGDNILLAAAAGSGKTAVLVQRIIELISNEKAGSELIDVNRLLVLTFTEAAASEMRGKISSAVNRALEENPENQYLRRQSLLIHSASISTIHSFCLNTLKSYIHFTDLPVDFTIVSETENNIMLKTAIDNVLERFYGKIDKDTAFKNLVLGYGGIKNDLALRDLIMALIKFSKSMPYPANWLNEAVRNYEYTAKTGKLSDNFLKLIRKITEEYIEETTEIYETIQKIISERLFEEHPYFTFFKEEWEELKSLFKRIKNADYENVWKCFQVFEFQKLKPGVKGAEGDVLEAQNLIKQYRAIARKSYKKIKECFHINEEDVIKRLCLTYPIVRTLKNIVLMVDRSYTKEKRRKSYLDFNDLEHETLKLLVGKDGKPTDVAYILREKYQEILIDEYQDTNYIQDAIFQAVSRENSNIFMVGDLKQSIYKFRNAVPALFLNKYESYAKEENKGKMIKLFKNFRSRMGVINAVNFIFEHIMSNKVGDLNYDENEFLIKGAQYPNLENEFKTELHMICRDGEIPEDYDGELETDKTELEAKMAASRIIDILNKKTEVFDKNTGEMRSVEYRDIVILMRNTGSTAPVFEKILSEYKIPVYTDVGRSYLGSVEVQTVLAFLQIIENPMQDIPLIAVMRSPMFGFSADELANIRIGMRKGNFYEAVKKSIESGNEKAKAFLEQLNILRDEAEYSGVSKLIWKIYYDFGYYEYSGSLTRGVERQANLRLLFERATEFEKTRIGSLFGFINFIDTMWNEGDDLTPAKVFGESENVVRIMSIHKSKGLEFPIVILADLSHRFNMTDVGQNIIWHENIGIGADYTDSENRVRYPSLSRVLISEHSKRDLVSEEMRLLYVAMTRAREKLIMISTFKESEKNWKEPLYNKNGKTLIAYVKNSLCLRDWIVSALMKHPKAAELREWCGINDSENRQKIDFELDVKIYKNAAEVLSPIDNKKEDCREEENIDNNLYDEMTEKLSYEYPHKILGDIPAKMSVSEAKRIQIDNGEYVPRLSGVDTSGLADITSFKGAERGTIIHFVMQMLDAKKVNNGEDVKKFVDELVCEGAITEQMAQVVDCVKIAEFFTGHLGNRIKKASRVEKEFSFYTETETDEIYHNGIRNKILLQGTIDCFFIENDGKIVLLDFKTDGVKTRSEAEKKAESYKIQMKYYMKGLGEILNKKVDECYLYFLNCGEAVQIF